MAIKYFNRLNNMNTITTTQLFISSFSNYRIHMDWINRLAIRMFIKNSTDSSEHIMHRRSKVFPSMSRYKNEFSIANPIKLRMSIIFLNSMLHCVNYCITGNINLTRIFSLFNKIVCSKLCRSKVKL